MGATVNTVRSRRKAWRAGSITGVWPVALAAEVVFMAGSF
jgi:hypothetical protein